MTDIEPKAHQDLFGHAKIVQQLKTAYDAGKLHHAMIFAGVEGIGKETLAYQLIRYMLAYPNGNPKQDDFKIPADHKIFRQIADGNNTHLKTVTPVFDEKKQRFARDITKESFDGLTDFLRLMPLEDAPRIILIHPAENMNRVVQNGLLKVLEEPPARTYFILLTNQPGALLPTTRSRCLMVDFEALNKDDFIEGLNHFNPEISNAKIESLYQLSQGALGRALFFEENETLDLYGDFCRAVLAWQQDNDSEPAMRFAEANGSSSQESSTEELYTLWVDRLSQVIKAIIARKKLEPIIPEEERLLQLWLNIDPQSLLAGYDRLRTMWSEGTQGYLDKKLILLKALNLLSTMDSLKQAVLT
jgi:DNA polymerase-3 subunit delta'